MVRHRVTVWDDLEHAAPYARRLLATAFQLSEEAAAEAVERLDYEGAVEQEFETTELAERAFEAILAGGADPMVVASSGSFACALDRVDGIVRERLRCGRQVNGAFVALDAAGLDAYLGEPAPLLERAPVHVLTAPPRSVKVSCFAVGLAVGASVGGFFYLLAGGLPWLWDGTGSPASVVLLGVLLVPMAPLLVWSVHRMRVEGRVELGEDELVLVEGLHARRIAWTDVVVFHDDAGDFVRVFVKGASFAVPVPTPGERERTIVLECLDRKGIKRLAE